VARGYRDGDGPAGPRAFQQFIEVPKQSCDRMVTRFYATLEY
jgi:hypothetical protein